MNFSNIMKWPCPFVISRASGLFYSLFILLESVYLLSLTEYKIDVFFSRKQFLPVCEDNMKTCSPNVTKSSHKDNNYMILHVIGR